MNTANSIFLFNEAFWGFKPMILRLFLVGVSIAPAFPAFSIDCTAITSDSCDFYSECVEEKITCGNEGYALGYGDKYCNRFKDETSFSEEGAAWRDNTLVCLQTKLLPFVEHDHPAELSCQGLRQAAFDSHPPCYTSPGYSICDLGVGDLYTIYGIIDGGDMLSSEGLTQMRRVASSCILDLTFGRNIGMFSLSASPSGGLGVEGDSSLEERLEFWHRVEAGAL